MVTPKEAEELGFAKTEHHFTRLVEAQRKGRELHLSVVRNRDGSYDLYANPLAK